MSRRKVKHKIKNKLRKKMNRSGHEYCSICHQQTILVEHHINGRKIPNANHDDNLASLCDSCHRLVHEKLTIIEGWFMTTEGRKLFWHKKNDENFTGSITHPYIIP